MVDIKRTALKNRCIFEVVSKKTTTLENKRLGTVE